MGSDAHPLANMTFSASRTQTILNCERKAGWQYIAGIEDPGNQDTELGQKVHAELEAVKSQPGYLPNRLTEAGAIAIEALPYVEDFSPENGAKPEGEFFLRGRHPWRGFIDLRKPGSLVDYKTTSDFKWAKTEQELLYDPQAVLYAVHEFSRWDGDTVDLMWLYLHKKKHAAKPVKITMTRAHAMRVFAAMEAFADDFQARADAAPVQPELRARYVLDVLKPNTSHCGAYRGCPYRDRCNIGFFTTYLKGIKTVGLLEKLEAMDAMTEPGNATQAEPQLPVPSGAFAPGGAFAGTEAAALVEQVTSESTDPNPTARMLEVAEPAENAVNPPKRGRPKGSKNKAKETEQPALSPAPAEPATEIKVTGPAPAPTPAASKEHRIGTLYVGCIPRGFDEGQLADFDMLIARAKVGIGPQDWRLFEYGKGNGLLLDMFKGIVDHDKPESIVVADPRSPEAILCLSYLRGASDSVVEAVAR